MPNHLRTARLLIAAALAPLRHARVPSANRAATDDGGKSSVHRHNDV